MDVRDDDVAHGPRHEDEALETMLLGAAAILEGIPDAVVATRADRRIVFVNALAEELFGYPRHELVGRPVQMLWPERVRERYTDNMELYFATTHPLRFSTEVWGLRRDGSEFVGEMSWGVVRTATEPLLLAIGRDISERRATEARLRAMASMGERALAGAEPSDLARDAVGLVTSSLPVASAEVRLADGTVLASSGPLTKVGITLPIGTGDELLLAPEREFTNQEIGLARAVANTLATALARLWREERLRHDAVHDPLTGLANRILLRDHLELALARAEREGAATGVLYVDLDNFKQINDSYGHATGDVLLTRLGGRLQTAIRPADTVARVGGDEFVAVCEKVDENSALALAQRLQQQIRVPMTIDGVAHGLSASIGVALGHADPDALLGNADMAVYRAKAGGPGRVELFH
jgi:diguanylate cyclase (GGDEF)-like protein/PAS domain S-box-containing protein